MTPLEQLAVRWEERAGPNVDAVTDAIWKCASELREFSAWRPASEPPNHNGTVIASVQEKDGDRFTTFACFMDNRWLREDGSEPIFWIVTHWQPLPEPPKGETK